MLLLPAVIAAMALPVAPALAGEEDDSATLHASSQDARRAAPRVPCWR